MKRLAVGVVGVLCAGVLQADPNGDRPDARHAWAVHDENRPRPAMIVAPEGRPPSDAIVLFDGTQKSVDEHWGDGAGGPSKWGVRDGLFCCVPHSGSVHARDLVGDCQIHVEFMIPDPPGDGLGNSGVYVHGLYELQVLESSGAVTRPELVPPWIDDYADGQLGAVYGQNPPLVNPARAPGQWQSYDIVFHPSVWDGERLVAPAEMTVFLNGVLIQDAWKLEGPTLYCTRTANSRKEERPLRPALMLQDHENPVPYRNIWLRKIPSRRANRVSGEFFDAAEAKALRRQLAAQTLKLARETSDMARKLVWLWESYRYEASDAVLGAITDLTPKYVARLDALNGEVPPSVALELSDMSGFVDMGIRCGMFEKTSPIVVAVRQALKRTKAEVLHR